jgi:Gram-negative bacterial TonB protein C-terminal
MKRESLYLGLLAAAAGALVWNQATLGQTPGRGAPAVKPDAAQQPDIPNPQDGSVQDQIYKNKYFGLTYPLQSRWSEDTEGPKPSYEGYYVLSRLKAEPSDNAHISMFLAARDLFFGAKPISNAKEYAVTFRDAQAAIPGMTIDREPSEITLAGHKFMRVDYSGVGLYRAWLATDIRCHLVSFNITATDPNALDEAARSLQQVSLPEEASADTTGASADGSSIPVCVKDYATEANVVYRVAPEPAGNNFQKIPVRITVGTDGSVRHVNVIRAFPRQKQSIEAALLQWKLKPYEVNGHPVEVETGLMFEFKPRV